MYVLSIMLSLMSLCIIIDNHRRINKHIHSKKRLATLIWVGHSLFINMCDPSIKKHPAQKSQLCGIQDILLCSVYVF